MKSGIIFFIICFSFLQMNLTNACNHYKISEAKVKGCKNDAEIHQIIEEAIFVGAPTYNQGNPLGCFRIYEGAAYKIIYLYGSKCRDIKKLLQTAIKKCDDYFSASDKAWIMRRAFDEILGVPTITK